jgi:glycosyltransferase involved in cell wall biosynthesis
LFERLDLDVHVRQPVVDDSGVDYEQSIGELCEWLATRRYDVALVNTVVAFPAADACLRLGIPTAWAIHESYPLPLIAPTFRISPTGAARLEAALRSATKLVFVSEATRRLYQAYLPATPCVTLPYGVDIDGLDGWRTGFDTGRTRSGIRGLDAVGKLILCVGAITPRKGQVPLVQAFATIADRHPGALLQFVGAFRGTLPGGLSAVAAAYGIEDRVLVEPEVADVRPWYASADLLVSASEVESLPRSMLEAMALGLPVLGTAVFGVPELITDGETGWLCEPNDVGALADSLDRVLSLDPAERERVARNAHLKVRDEYRSDLRSPAWGELLSELARG